MRQKEIPRYTLVVSSLLFSILFTACSSSVSVQQDKLFAEAEDTVTDAELAELRANFDTDSDGLHDAEDPCPATAANDSDGDGVCEEILSDINGDGCVDLGDQSILAETYGQSGEGLAADLVPDGQINISDVAVMASENGQCQDNCPNVANVDQADEDLDGVGDLCEDLPEVDPGSPTIQRVTGPFSNRGTMTISGGNFGVKEPAAPLVWYDFDNGSDGLRFEDDPDFPFGLEGGNIDPAEDPQYSDEFLRGNRGLNAKIIGPRNALEYGRDGFNWQYDGSDPIGDKTIWSWWIRWDEKPNLESQIKSAYVRNSANGGPSASYIYGPNSNWQRVQVYFEGDGDRNMSLPHATEKWIRVFNEVDLGTYGEANGQWYLEYLGATVKRARETNWALKQRPDDKLDFARWIHYLGNTPWEDDHTITGYFDDVYIDNTWARVELGDNPVYENCTVREFQIPSAWGDGEIAVTFNQGGFAEGEQVYLFVVNERGDRSPGYGPMTLD